VRRKPWHTAGYHQAVIRGLLVFVLVAAVLAVAAACGVPAADVQSPGSPLAQATNVRRTEVAEAQRIIANYATATSTAVPTPVAPPTCRADGAIWWYEARAHMGESRTVQGTVLATRLAPGGLALLEIGQRYPDPTGLAVLLPASPAASMNGKTVCVTGHITTVEGRPTIPLSGASSIQVLS
jgi:hypothetical protein